MTDPRVSGRLPKLHARCLLRRLAAQKLKHFEVNRQISLRVLANRLHQVPAFHQHLIGVVVQCGIFEQHAHAAFASGETI